MFNNFLLLGLVVCGFLLSGCSNNDPRVSYIEARWASRVLHPMDPILAQVGPYIVTSSEYENFLRTMFGPTTVTTNPGERRGYLTTCFRLKVFPEVAKKEGLPQDPTYLQAPKSDRMRALMQWGTVLVSQMPVTNEELQQYYAGHQGEFPDFGVGYRYSVSQSLKQAQNVITLLKKGRPVPGLTSGVFPASNANAQQKVWEAVIRTLQPGQISSPIRTLEGFLVIQRDLKPISSFEAVKQQVKTKLQLKKFETLCDHEFAGLKITIDEDLLNSFSTVNLQS